MPTNTDQCLRCEGEMEQGFTLGGVGGHHGPVLWVRGEAKFGALGGLKLGIQAKYRTITKRCTECGWLDFYTTKQYY